MFVTRKRFDAVERERVKLATRLAATLAELHAALKQAQQARWDLTVMAARCEKAQAASIAQAGRANALQAELDRIKAQRLANLRQWRKPKETV